MLIRPCWNPGRDIVDFSTTDGQTLRLAVMFKGTRDHLMASLTSLPDGTVLHLGQGIFKTSQCKAVRDDQGRYHFTLTLKEQ